MTVGAKARLGHASAKLSMELYAHVPEAADQRAAENLNARFERVREDEPTGLK